MLFKVVVRQIRFLLKQKEAILTIILLFWIIIINYLSNVFAFRGIDVSQMYHPMKLLTISYNRINYNANSTLLIVMLYPFLVSLPAGFSYIKEHQTKEEIFFITRLGREKYIISKLFAVFFVTTIVFLIPFLTEIFMNCLSFPLNAQCDLSNLSVYSTEYSEMVHNYFGYPIFLYSPVLYAVSGTVFFSILSGIIAMFTVSISFVISVRYRVALLLPAFILLNLTIYLDKLIEEDTARISWYEYMMLFSNTKKNTAYAVIAIMICLICIVCCYYIGKKMEKF